MNTGASNPLREGLAREKVPEPCVVVVFGGTGDLAARKLLPALYRLHLEGLLPRGFAVVAYASPNWTDDDYRRWVREALSRVKPPPPLGEDNWQPFAGMLHFVRRTDDTSVSMLALKDRLAQLDSTAGTGNNCVFYLALPPSVFAETAAALGEHGLAQQTRDFWRRIVVEKPFGQDLRSARELNGRLQEVFREDQIYRIDHYVGKETVQNILVLRFANRFAEPLLSRRHVDHIQITVAETIGVEGRGGFYDSTGALRDIIQNHAFQILSLVCMEPPASLAAESVRDAKVNVLRSVARIKCSDVEMMAVRGQYGSGRLLGEHVRAYREEDNVAPDSKTETYAALKLHIDNERWRGVPIYVRTGKRLAKRVTEVAVQLKQPQPALFGNGQVAIEPNLLAVNVQPDEGISVRFEGKLPGLGFKIQPVKMDFRYLSAFRTTAPEAYERLLLDALVGDASLFARADITEVSWEIIEPVLQAWKHDDLPVHEYRPGSWGPRAAAELIERDGRKWRLF